MSVDVGQALAEAGYDPAAFGLDAAIREFQAAHVGPDGHHLDVDGVVGPFTAWALEHPGAGTLPNGYTVLGWRRDDDAAPQEARAPLAAAIAEIGEHEDPDGSNSGPRVDVYEAPHKGLAWCAYFVSWAWQRAGAPFGQIGSAYGLRDWARVHGRLVTEPLPGDVAVLLRDGEDPPAGGPRRGHAWMVAAVLGDGRHCTVEGNSSNAVRGLVRPNAQASHFIRPLGLL